MLLDRPSNDQSIFQRGGERGGGERGRLASFSYPFSAKVYEVRREVLYNRIVLGGGV